MVLGHQDRAVTIGAQAAQGRGVRITGRQETSGYVRGHPERADFGELLRTGITNDHRSIQARAPPGPAAQPAGAQTFRSASGSPHQPSGVSRPARSVAPSAIHRLST